MKYIKKTLSNGMTIILAPMKQTQIICMGFFIKAGSRNETSEDSGIAHFLEHMMFKGTKTRSAEKLFYELDTAGALYNAGTTTQNTNYYIYGNCDDTKKLLDIVLDIYINPYFPEKEINKEKKVIIEEMRMRTDMPMMKLYIAMHKKIFHGTSLSREVIGTKESVMGLKKRDLVIFRETFYKPDNTVFVITGNFNPELIYKSLSKVLDNLTNPSLEIKNYENEKDIIIKQMMNQDQPYVYIKKNLLYQQVYIMLVFPIYDFYKYRSKEVDLLSELLSSGFSSRLTRALREQNGITYNSTSYPISYSDVGLFIIQMVINPIEFIKGIKIVFRELKKLKEETISDEEMQKIIKTLKNDNIFSRISPIDMLNYYGFNFLENRNFKPHEHENIDDIKKTDLRALAEEIFVRDKINLFIYGNIEETNFDFIDL